MIHEDDFPPLVGDCDRLAVSTRRNHYLTVGVQLGLIASVTILPRLTKAVGFPPLSILSPVMTMILLGSLALSAYERLAGHERSWLDLRAMAEQAKSETWRFMICAHPSSDHEAAAGDLLTRFSELRTLRPAASGMLELDGLLREQVPAAVREVRQLSRPEREKLYLGSRVEAQLAWYVAKAGAIRLKGRNLNWSIHALQLTSLCYAILFYRSPSFQPAVIAVLMGLSGCLIAWTQAQRVGELAHRYTVAAADLRFLMDRRRCDSEDDLAAFVESAEEIIVGENALWAMKSPLAQAGRPKEDSHASTPDEDEEGAEAPA
jgi:hypothetical protein